MKKWFSCLWASMMILSQGIWADVLDVHIYYVGPTQGQVWMGVQQGLQEANLQGEFLGQKYTLRPVTKAALFEAKDINAVLVAADAKTVLDIARNPKLEKVPVFNLIADDDALRLACLPNLLSITPSRKMKQDALAQWQKKHPDTKVQVRVWHESFRKFAASQLNGRFQKTFHVPMGDEAWAGWAAVKLLSDTVARTQHTQPAAMLDYLRHDIAFDGQKGDGATFRETGQLRQIVLIVENNKIVAEAPLRGVKGGLDSLGFKSCQKGKVK